MFCSIVQNFDEFQVKINLYLNIHYFPRATETLFQIFKNRLSFFETLDQISNTVYWKNPQISVSFI